MERRDRPFRPLAGPQHTPTVGAQNGGGYDDGGDDYDASFEVPTHQQPDTTHTTDRRDRGGFKSKPKRRSTTSSDEEKEKEQLNHTKQQHNHFTHPHHHRHHHNDEIGGGAGEGGDVIASSVRKAERQWLLESGNLYYDPSCYEGGVRGFRNYYVECGSGSEDLLNSSGDDKDHDNNESAIRRLRRMLGASSDSEEAEEQEEDEEEDEEAEGEGDGEDESESESESESENENGSENSEVASTSSDQDTDIPKKQGQSVANGSHSYHIPDDDDDDDDDHDDCNYYDSISSGSSAKRPMVEKEKTTMTTAKSTRGPKPAKFLPRWKLAISSDDEDKDEDNDDDNDDNDDDDDKNNKGTVASSAPATLARKKNNSQRKKQAQTRNKRKVAPAILLRKPLVPTVTGREKADNSDNDNTDSDAADAAEIDPLTCIPNRQAFGVALKSVWIRRPLKTALIMCDIDCFKLLNDRQGRAVADQCLRKVAKIVASFGVRPDTHDIAARLGAIDKFAVLVEGIETPTLVRATAERLCREVESLRLPNPGSPVSRYVTISVGVAFLSFSGQLSVTTSEEFMQQADRALYAAKCQGRNCVHVYGQDTAENTQEEAKYKKRRDADEQAEAIEDQLSKLASLSKDALLREMERMLVAQHKVATTVVSAGQKSSESRLSPLVQTAQHAVAQSASEIGGSYCDIDSLIKGIKDSAHDTHHNTDANNDGNAYTHTDNHQRATQLPRKKGKKKTARQVASEALVKSEDESHETILDRLQQSLSSDSGYDEVYYGNDTATGDDNHEEESDSSYIVPVTRILDTSHLQQHNKDDGYETDKAGTSTASHSCDDNDNSENDDTPTKISVVTTKTKTTAATTKKPTAKAKQQLTAPVPMKREAAGELDDKHALSSMMSRFMHMPRTKSSNDDNTSSTEGSAVIGIGGLSPPKSTSPLLMKPKVKEKLVEVGKKQKRGSGLNNEAKPKMWQLGMMKNTSASKKAKDTNNSTNSAGEKVPQKLDKTTKLKEKGKEKAKDQGKEKEPKKEKAKRKEKEKEKGKEEENEKEKEKEKETEQDAKEVEAPEEEEDEDTKALLSLIEAGQEDDQNDNFEADADDSHSRNLTPFAQYAFQAFILGCLARNITVVYSGNVVPNGGTLMAFAVMASAETSRRIKISAMFNARCMRRQIEIRRSDDESDSHDHNASASMLEGVWAENTFGLHTHALARLLVGSKESATFRQNVYLAKCFAVHLVLLKYLPLQDRAISHIAAIGGNQISAVISDWINEFYAQLLPLLGAIRHQQQQQMAVLIRYPAVCDLLDGRLFYNVVYKITKHDTTNTDTESDWLCEWLGFTRTMRSDLTKLWQEIARLCSQCNVDIGSLSPLQTHKDFPNGAAGATADIATSHGLSQLPAGPISTLTTPIPPTVTSADDASSTLLPIKSALMEGVVGPRLAALPTLPETHPTVLDLIDNDKYQENYHWHSGALGLY
eukprot:TRINITY_DN6146_c0_g2_i2.p1 TRINITY_DN6146_c0_g2~~TRINITY_DN6146_c0_g2_i2.p1  ORF type:complete len:1465 (+),score=393.34 TRINITY_DN6146_c0_g2_i2:108-4502(+)